MNTVRVDAFAKLNLTLEVTGRQNGYHLLDSIVVTVDLCDRIVVKKRKDPLIAITMRGMGSESISPDENNAVKAAEKFVSEFETCGADITVYKNIPMGAGLGGSSADAAGVLNALAKLYGITDRAAIKRIADETGSDTGYLLQGGLARLRGRGNEVQSLGECPDMNFLIICPKSGVSAAECYREFDNMEKTHCACTQSVLEKLRSQFLSGAAGLFNQLYPAAAVLNPDVKTALEQAESFSPVAACMTGSGSAVFALFETAEMCAWAKSRYRGKFRTYCVRATDGKSTCDPIRNPFVIDGESGF